MNRVLSWPHTPMLRALLEHLKTERQETAVSPRGMVRIEHELGTAEMNFSVPEQQLEPGTQVYVWWKGGGFVCAAISEFKAEEREARSIAEQVLQARSQLAAARKQRQESRVSHVDIELPADDPASRPAA
jgi:hypothetical protein